MGRHSDGSGYFDTWGEGGGPEEADYSGIVDAVDDPPGSGPMQSLAPLALEEPEPTEPDPADAPMPENPEEIAAMLSGQQGGQDPGQDMPAAIGQMMGGQVGAQPAQPPSAKGGY